MIIPIIILALLTLLVATEPDRVDSTPTAKGPR